MFVLEDFWHEHFMILFTDFCIIMKLRQNRNYRCQIHNKVLLNYPQPINQNEAFRSDVGIWFYPIWFRVELYFFFGKQRREIYVVEGINGATRLCKSTKTEE